MANELAKQETRRAVLQLLSDDETAQISDPNAVRRLAAGEEYLDLEEPIEGVHRLGEGRSPMGRILPRRAVDGRTWQLILDVIVAGPEAIGAGAGSADVSSPLPTDREVQCKFIDSLKWNATRR